MKPDQTSAADLLSLEQEEQLLVHFRQHSHAGPSPQLDAYILAAASAAASAAAAAGTATSTTASPSRHNQGPQQSWLARCWAALRLAQTPRWSVAVAGLACVGLALNLSWRNNPAQPAPMLMSEQASGVIERFAAPAPQAAEAQLAADAADAAPASPAMAARSSAPVPASAAAAAPVPEAVSQSLAKQAAVPVMGREVQGASELGVAGSGMLPTQQEQRLLAQLEQLLALRHKGASAQAKTLLQKLEHDYPQVDIEARLQQLQSPP